MEAKDYVLRIVEGRVKVIAVENVDPFTIPVTPYSDFSDVKRIKMKKKLK